MTDALRITDNESAANAHRPRVTLDSMEAKIADIHYIVHENVLTICIIRMQNGFYVVGESAPASPENFVIDLGRKFAYENAIRKLWSLEGYALRQALSEGKVL